MSRFGVGQSVRRTEDLRFLTGGACYVDDLARSGQCMLSSCGQHMLMRASSGSTWIRRAVFQVYSPS